MKQWGAARTGLFLVGLLLALGVLRAWRRVELDPQSGAPAIIDAQSVWRLRRVALAIETSRLPQSDSMLSYPNSVGSMALPLYDELLAIVVRGLTGGRVGAPKEGLDEALLVDKVLRVGPILGLLFLLAMHRWWIRWLGLSSRAACFASLWAASLPVLLHQTHSGILSIELFASLVALGASALLFQTFRAKSVLDRFTLAMLVGALCGLGLVTSPLFLLLVFGAWCAFLFNALSAHGELRIEWVRTFLLFWITCGLGALLPSLGGPWVPSASGVIQGWTDLCSNLIVMGAAPFLLMLWTQGKAWKVDVLRWFAPGVVLLMVLGFALTRGFGADHRQFALLFANLQWTAHSSWSAHLSPTRVILLVTGMVGAAELFRAWGGQWTATGVLLCVWGTGALALAFAFEPVALFAVPVVVGLAGRAFDRSATFKWAAAGLLLCIGVSVWDSVEQHHNPDEEGLAVMAAARALREMSEPTGSHNTVFAVHRWGVLADERCAPLVVWYGRRACASLGPARNGDQEGSAALRQALGSSSVSSLILRLREMGLRWSLVGPASARRWVGSGADSALMAGFIGSAPLAGEIELRELRRP